MRRSWQARKLHAGETDAALVDEALAALLARHRSAEVDASYAVYDRLGRLADMRMREVCSALAVAVDCSG